MNIYIYTNDSLLYLVIMLILLLLLFKFSDLLEIFFFICNAYLAYFENILEITDLTDYILYKSITYFHSVYQMYLFLV